MSKETTRGKRVDRLKRSVAEIFVNSSFKASAFMTVVKLSSSDRDCFMVSMSTPWLISSLI